MNRVDTDRMHNSNQFVTNVIEICQEIKKLFALEVDISLIEFAVFVSLWRHACNLLIKYEKN